MKIALILNLGAFRFFLLVLKRGLNPVYNNKINKIFLIIHKMVHGIFIANDIGLELSQTLLPKHEIQLFTNQSGYTYPKCIIFLTQIFIWNTNGDLNKEIIYFICS